MQKVESPAVQAPVSNPAVTTRDVLHRAAANLFLERKWRVKGERQHRPARWPSLLGLPMYECRYCGLKIQRRGLLRRWRHVA